MLAQLFWSASLLLSTVTAAILVMESPAVSEQLFVSSVSAVTLLPPSNISILQHPTTSIPQWYFALLCPDNITELRLAEQLVNNGLRILGTSQFVPIRMFEDFVLGTLQSRQNCSLTSQPEFIALLCVCAALFVWLCVSGGYGIFVACSKRNPRRESTQTSAGAGGRLRRQITTDHSDPRAVLNSLRASQELTERVLQIATTLEEVRRRRDAISRLDVPDDERRTLRQLVRMADSLSEGS